MIKIKLRELLWEKDKTGVELHNATGISQAKISEIIPTPSLTSTTG